MGVWWSWVLLVLGDDLSYYLHHRAGHTVRLLWARHVTHHSSQEYNFAVALRQAWGELATKYVWYAWLPLLGFHPLAILTMAAVSLVYQFFLHTEVVGRLERLGLFLNTPSHHRVHHGSNIRYLDRNHGGMLILWDRLFGTFEPEREGGAGGLRPHLQHPVAQPLDARLPRVRGDLAGREARPGADGPSWATSSCLPAGATTAAR